MDKKIKALLAWIRQVLATRKIEAELRYHFCGQPLYRRVHQGELVSINEIVGDQVMRRRVARDIVRYYNPAGYYDERNPFMDALATTRCPNCGFVLDDDGLSEQATTAIPLQLKEEGINHA